VKKAKKRITVRTASHLGSGGASLGGRLPELRGSVRKRTGEKRMSRKRYGRGKKKRLAT